MKKKIFYFAVCGLMFAICLPVFAFGDGYVDCELDQIYASNAKGKPTTGLFLRQRACMSDSPVLKTLPANEEVDIIAETDGWYKVKDKTGAIGWVGARLVSITRTSTVSGSLGSEHYAYGVNKGLDEPARKRILERVKGYILLQVESKGEAWYVDPVLEKRTYMKDGASAFQMMRNFGLGISNANLEKLKNGDLNLGNRLRGRIVLQVEASGEAYYVHPKDLSVHYLKNGEEAYRIMRELSLGITNSDLKAISE